jgi:hypothetical protein
MRNNLLAITLPGSTEYLYVLSNDEIKEGDSVAYKETFLDGTVKTEVEYNSKEWVLMRNVSADWLPGFHRAQYGRNSKAGISGCYKIIASSDPLLNLPVPIIFSPEQLKDMITVVHSAGWDDGVSDNITCSETSFSNLKNTLFNLFKIEL